LAFGRGEHRIAGVDREAAEISQSASKTLERNMMRQQEISPAINAGDNTGAPATDQRGRPRILGGTIDIGAFESKFGLIAIDHDVSDDDLIVPLN
jgi:hypothetical protein